MKNWITFLFVSVCFFACTNEKNQKNETTAFIAEKPSSECDKSRLQICNDGIPFAKIGDSLLGVKTAIPEITGMKDSMIHTEDYTAFLRILYFKQGEIILEGTHFNKEDEKPEISRSHIDIIHITTPVFETPEKIKVGSTFADLQKIYADSLFELQPGGTSGMIELKVPKVSRLNYEFKQGKSTEQIPGMEANGINSIAADAKVAAISLY